MSKTPTPEVQRKATKKYFEKTVDRLYVCVPKGEKERIQNHIIQTGESINAFVARAIIETMERDNNS